jgi:hypothetical protein
MSSNCVIASCVIASPRGDIPGHYRGEPSRWNQLALSAVSVEIHCRLCGIPSRESWPRWTRWWCAHITLSANESRRLLATLAFTALTGIDHVMHWSAWRRERQHQANDLRTDQLPLQYQADLAEVVLAGPGLIGPAGQLHGRADAHRDSDVYRYTAVADGPVARHRAVWRDVTPASCALACCGIVTRATAASKHANTRKHANTPNVRTRIAASR